MQLFSSKRNLLMYFALFLLSATCGWSQTGTTSLRGVVTDMTGAAVPGAKVTLSNQALGLNRQMSTGSFGEYEFLSLPPGTYELTIEMTNFKKYEQTNLQLLVNTPGTANVKLEIGAALQTVEVSAQAVTLNTSDASLGVAFGESQVKELPLEARNVPDLLSLQAGVAYTGNRSDINKDLDSRSGAVNGAHSDQSNITLDGVDVNDETRGYAFTSVLPVTPDSIQEFRVTTTNYNADEGRSSGAQVSLVTKSGTNNFHGSAYEYMRNTITSANDYFVKLGEEQGCQNSGIPLSDSQCNKAPKLIRNIFGGSAGGPLWKDRLYFFANYEGTRQREQNSVVRIVPSDAMRDGVIMYACADPTQCPGGNVQGVSSSHVVPAGDYGLSITQTASMDPLGKGANPAVLKYLQSFPHANDTSQGDGLNYVAYRFAGPVPTNDNWYIARMDYKITRDGNHSLFWRGALRNDTQSGVPYLPGQASLQTLADYSKGFTVGYTGTLRPTLINNFRWGYTRQSIGNIGNSNQTVIFFRGLNDNSTANNSSDAVTRTTDFQVPVHNFVDDISWLRGKHTLQFGTNVAVIRNPHNSFSSSFSDGVTNASWLPKAAIANTGTFMDPAVSGLPAVNSSFGNSYDYPMMTLLGAVSQVDAQYNYNKDGSVLAQGAALSRNFAADSYEFYLQDSWKVKSNLTVIYGLRYSLFSPPWETKGLEVTPSLSLGQWFNSRAQNMNQGIGSWADPTIAFDLGGPANGKPGFYNWDYKDFGPRIGVAWSPSATGGLLGSLFGGPGKSSIRAGFGIVYDRIGQGLLATFNRRGSFGMSTTLTNKAAIETLMSAPRLTDLNTVPTTDNNMKVIFAPAPPGGFPQTFPNENQHGGYAATFGLDSSIKTPYSYTLDLSVGRELSHGLTLEASYVGRLSHRLLAQSDLAQPADLVDPKSRIDYYTAVQALARVYRGGTPSTNVTSSTIGPAAVYWQNILQPLKTGGAYTMSSCTPLDATGHHQVLGTADPVQAAYDWFCGNSFNETTALQFLDQSGIPDFNLSGVSYNASCGQTGSNANCFVNSQYASLFAWRSVGTASYHALQVTLRRPMTHGLQFDLNYTFSKSIDMESDAERADLLGAGSLGLIINAWRPKQLRAVSDFDTPHQINANWIAELPFGKGKAIGTEAHGFREAVIGGWQLSGLARWTSGFPISIGNGAAWATNWNLAGNAIQVGTAATGLTKNPPGYPAGSVNLFPNPQGANGIGAFIKNLPGDSGTRNSLRGDGFAGLDMNLSKRWKLPWKESQTLQFRWEVFNVLNLTRFDVQSITTSIDSGSFGNYSGLLTNPRVMQFALRYEF